MRSEDEVRARLAEARRNLSFVVRQGFPLVLSAPLIALQVTELAWVLGEGSPKKDKKP